jgi:NADPH-dependent glutamate synthase beta subunit-like oxidoreductase
VKTDPSTSASALSGGALAASALRLDRPQDFHWLERNIPCRSACPAGTDIPGYLEAVYQGRHAEAYAINLRDNVFPGVLGRVCSRPCEPACRHGREGNGEPVAICFSKRSAADLMAAPPARIEPLFPPGGSRVAVVGAGVAGLAAARELALLGHGVAVYERHSRPGGMLNQGIPAFRLPREWIEREVAQVIATGVEMRCGVQIGRDVPLAELVEEHDAVVLAAGTLRPNAIDVPGERLAGVEHGLDFLFEVNEACRRSVGRTVAVIGGGYTAMDCARTALRLGARVTVYYRRRRGDMVVLPGELEAFLAEGGTLVNEAAPMAMIGEAGRVAGIRLVRTVATQARSGGRGGFEPVDGSGFEVEADQVILAIGQRPDTTWIDAPLGARLVARDGWLASGDRPETAVGKVFAAGDFALGATTLIRAIGHAKQCARRVDRFLTGRERLRDGVVVGRAGTSRSARPVTTGRSAAMNAIPIRPMPMLPVAARELEAEVETGYPAATAREEASRCYLCHYKFEIIDSRCVLCDECLKVKPVPGCIVEIAGLVRDDDGRITGHLPVTAGRTDSLYYNRLWIDQDKCVRCGQCEAVCPVGAITIQKVVPMVEATGQRESPRETLHGRHGRHGGVPGG